MRLICTIPSTAPGAVLSLKKDRASLDLTQAELDFIVHLADVLLDMELAQEENEPLEPASTNLIVNGDLSW